MTEDQIIAKIQRYIDLTAVPDNQYYDIPGYELAVLYHSRKLDYATMLHMVYEYGKAKGYRQGKKKRQKV